MELRHLRYFVAVAEESSVGRAARRLNVAQPALSRQIHDLERELGVALFERLPRGIALTDPGRAFLTEAQAMLEHADRAKQTARRFALGQRGRVVVGYVEAANNSGLLPSAIRLHGERRPGVRVELTRLTSAQQWSAVGSHQIDVGFVHARPESTDGLAFAPVLDDPGTGVLLAATHRLARKRELAAADLREEPMLLFPRAANPALYDRVLATFRTLGLDPVVTHELPDVSGAFAFIARSVGWYVSPPSVRDVLPHGVIFRHVRGLYVPFGIDLMWRAERAPAMMAFVETVMAVSSGRAADVCESHLDFPAAG